MEIHVGTLQHNDLGSLYPTHTQPGRISVSLGATISPPRGGLMVDQYQTQGKPHWPPLSQSP